MFSQRRQAREGHQEFHRSCKPQPETHRRAILAEEQDQKSDAARKQGRLPEMVQQACDHASFFLLAARSLSSFSASTTSLDVRLPASINWAITGCIRPPKMERNSSTNRTLAASRA